MNDGIRFAPMPGRRTYRLELKRSIRNYLAPISAGAPTTRATLLAAREMAKLVSESTGHKLQLQIADPQGRVLSPEEISEAIRTADQRDFV